ncbi:hypothetical protein U1Q18_045682, partial [Sarracenia purpurea var. burkii]
MDETNRNGRLDLNLEPDLVPDRRAATEGGWRRRSGERRGRMATAICSKGADLEPTTPRSVRRSWTNQNMGNWLSTVEVGEEEGGDGGWRRGREPTSEGENRRQGRRFVKETFVN